MIQRDARKKIVLEGERSVCGFVFQISDTRLKQREKPHGPHNLWGAIEVICLMVINMD